jgi:transposase
VKQRKYSPEFKQRAVALAQEMDNITEAARKLGVPKHTLYSWVTGRVPETAIPELPPEEQLRALRKENEELKKANYILKQAAAFFSQDHLK